jgi:short-subunit dehydrogenase involved in D-alanine esterification of teichoic acids
LKVLLGHVNLNDIEVQVMEILTKLFNEEPHTNRIALIQMIPSVYPHLSSNYKTTVINFIQKISTEEILPVKCEFFQNLKVIIEVNAGFSKSN